jgi:hypothetical protein
MTSKRGAWLAILAGLLALPSAHAANSAAANAAFAGDWPRSAVVPGGVALLELPPSDTAPVVRFGDRKVMVLRSAQGWRAVLGLALAQKPGPALVEVEQAGRKSQRKIVVQTKKYATQYLKVAPKQVDLSPEDAARVEREQLKLRAALTTFSADPPATLRLSRARAPAPLACGGSSTNSRAIPTVAWTSRPQPARRSRPRSPAWSSTRASISSTATTSSSITARAC